LKKNLIYFYFFLLCNAASGQDYNSAGERADNILNAFIDVARIPGLSIAVSVGDKIIYSNTFGLSDIDAKIPVNDSTRYRIGSVTKLFTAAVMAKLVEDGIINGNSFVSEYIKNLPETYSNTTIEQLASHTAGIRHYTRDEIMSTNFAEYSDLEDALYKFINDSLLSKPGDKYLYSSYGYTLLGAVLENALNKKFNEIISEYILIPAGMTNTEPEVMGKLITNRSQFYYSSKENGFTPAAGENFSYKWPAGGYLSTATDIAKFGSSLLNGKITVSKALTLLFNPQKTNDGKEIKVGYGFRIGKDNEGRKVLHHGGESPGARAFVLLYPEEKLTIAIVANVFGAPLFEGEAETIAGYFLNDYSYDVNINVPVIKFSTTNNEKVVNGEINFDEKKVTGLTNQDIPIADIVREKGKIRIIALSSSGIINIWLTDNNNKFEGKWGYDKETTILTIQ